MRWSNVSKCCSEGGRVRWVSNDNEVTVNGLTMSRGGNYTLQIDYIVQGERGVP